MYNLQILKKKKKNEHDYNSWHENKRSREKEIVTRWTERNKHALGYSYHWPGDGSLTWLSYTESLSYTTSDRTGNAVKHTHPFLFCLLRSRDSIASILIFHYTVHFNHIKMRINALGFLSKRILFLERKNCIRVSSC